MTTMYVYIRAARQSQFFSAGVVLMYLGTLNTKIKTKKSEK